MSVGSIVYEYVASEETYPKGSMIIEEGGRGSWVYIILEGRVKIKKKLSKGMLTINTLKEGDFLGETNFLKLKQGNRSASAIADTNVVLGVIDTNKLTNDWECVVPQLKRLISALMNRLQNVTDKIVALNEE